MLIDLTGKVFGRLMVLSRAGVNAAKHPLWKCRCECGQEVTIRGQSLRLGDTQSCGCLHKERASEAHRTHGQCKTPEHTTWLNIIQRCTNQRRADYARYGGRGIGVCERWRASFAAFLEDMGPRPSNDHSIERKDNSVGYEPGNCVWATQSEQLANRRALALESVPTDELIRELRKRGIAVS